MMPFARAFLFLTMGPFLFTLNQTLSGLNSCLIAVKQTANIYLTVKLEYHFQSVGCTQNPNCQRQSIKKSKSARKDKNLSLESEGFIPFKGNL